MFSWRFMCKRGYFAATGAHSEKKSNSQNALCYIYHFKDPFYSLKMYFSWVMRQNCDDLFQALQQGQIENAILQ